MLPRPLRWAMAWGIAALAASAQVTAPNYASADTPSPAPTAAESAPAGAPSLDPWPRSFSVEGATLVVYQPQVERWQGNRLEFRAAVGATPVGKTDEAYGVVWAKAITEVDRGTRQVALSNLSLDRASFPTLSDNGAAYLDALRRQLKTSGQTIFLDRLEASLAASDTVRATHIAVKNEPPRIIVSNTPAILIPIDGAPVLRALPNTGFQRVINTHACMLQETSSARYFLHVYDGWLQAAAPQGPWTPAESLPPGIGDVASDLVMKRLVDALAGSNAQPRPTLATGAPNIYVTTTPAELVLFHGKPDFQPIGSTSLLWANNTRSDVIVNTADGQTYVLLSGRWYRAPSLSGPWAYVESANLPPAFQSIPPSSAAGVVLPAVAGTQQAREAVIENSIPQTASIPLTGGPTFSASYDGSPQLRPIAGTSLQSVTNSATPLIRLDAEHWYALVAGIWFVAPASSGPWQVAAMVPAEIYAIPPSEPLHYVTYVQIYGGTTEVVYEGYTPGYMGTVVTADDVVVYGTGYDYDPWIGASWYGPPETWGVMAQPVYNPAVGYTYGFALGLTTAAVAASWASPVYYNSYAHPYACCGSATANVYGHYGYTNAAGSQTWYAKSNGTYGVKSSGSYENTRTGTTGNHSTNRSYNPYTGQQNASTDRSYDRASGGSGDVSRDASYNSASGTGSYDSNRSTTTAGGSTVDHSVNAESGEGVSRSTTVDNANTGQSHSSASGSNDGQRYAGADGNVYKSDGAGGWQQSAGNGSWKNASGDSSWADHEQARSSADGKFSGSQHGGYAEQGGGGGDRSFGGGGGGGGGFGGRYGGGGFSGGGGSRGGRR